MTERRPRMSVRAANAFAGFEVRPALPSPRRYAPPARGAGA